MSGGVAQRFQNLFFAFGFDLLVAERIAGNAIYSLQSDGIVASKSSDRAQQHGFAGGALADLPGDVFGEMCVGGFAHEAKLLIHFCIGKNVEEWRLFQVSGKGLFERAVEDGVSGGVGEIGENDGVGFAEFGRAMRNEIRTDSDGSDQDDYNDGWNEPSFARQFSGRRRSDRLRNRRDSGRRSTGR